MLKNNYKNLFYFLLIPFYLNMMIVLLFFSAGSIMWKSFFIHTITNFAGAWLLSFRRNILLNIVGFLSFICYGWPLFSIIFNPPKVGLWIYDVGTGILIMILGLLGLVYVTVKRIKFSMECE